MSLASDLGLVALEGTANDVARFSKHLDRSFIEEALMAADAATVRRRRLPAEQVLWLIVGMAMMRDCPIAEVVDRLELALPKPGRPSIAPSAVVKARARLGAAPMEWLFIRTGDEWAHRSAAADRWRGLALYGVDGTTFRVADSDENRDHFGGQPAGAKGRGDSGYPLVRLAALMALRSHLIASASFGPYGSELPYAETLWPSIPDDSLTLVDRNFLTASILVGLQRSGNNRHWMTRAKSTSVWRVIKKLGRGDWLVEFTVSSVARAKDATLPATFEARAIEYKRAGHQKQTVLTSLLDADQYPAAEVAALYHERWEIELGYDEIKTELLEREETLRSKSPAMVEQEIYGVLVAYNLIRLEMESIAAEAEVAPTRISFAVSLRFIREEWHWAWLTRTPGAIPKRLQSMRARIQRFVLPDRRSERSYPRAVKIKMSGYPRNRRDGRLK